MQRNVGSLDRIVRLVVGALILAYGYQTQSWLGLIGLIPIATALLRFCPLYTVVGCSSCRNAR